MKTSFTDKGLSEYMEWLEVDRTKLKKINDLIKSIKRGGLFSCKGHYSDIQMV